MSENTNRIKQQGCIVCGKIHNLLVVYAPYSKMVGCTVNSPGAHVVPDKIRPLASCSTHNESEIETALARHHPVKQQEEERED